MDPEARRVAELNDDQLREELKRYGYVVGPVVPSTRNVLQKRLVKYINSGAQPLNGSAVPPPSPSPSTPRKSRRNMSAAPTVTVTATNGDHHNDFEDSPQPKRSSRRQTSLGIPTPVIKVSTPSKTSTAQTKTKAARSLANYSSEEDEAEPEPARLTRGHTPPVLGQKSTAVSTPSKRVTPARPGPRVSLLGHDLNASPAVRQSPARMSTRGRTGLSTPNNRRVTLNSLNEDTTLPSNLANFSDSEGENEYVEETSPFPSPTTNDDSARERLLRLTQLRRRKTRNELSSISSITTQSFDDPDRGSRSSSWFSYLLPDVQSSTSKIPHLIFGAIVLIFVTIFAVYMFKTSNIGQYFGSGSGSTEVEPKDALDEMIPRLNTPICSEDMHKGHHGDHGGKCLLSRDDIKPAFLIIQEIAKIFESRILSYYCTKDSTVRDPSLITVKDLRKELVARLSSNRKFIDKLNLKFDEKETQSERDVKIASKIYKSAVDAIMLLELNPDFKIKPVVNEVAGTVMELFVNPMTFPCNWPFACRIKYQVFQVMTQVILYAAIISIAIIGYKYKNQLAEAARREEDLYYDLIDKTIDYLQTPDEPQSRPMLHIRDELISPQDRKNPIFIRAWERVVEYIETKESRIRTDLEEVDGETFKTWKWVAASSPGSSPASVRTGNIEWQGQAFNEQSFDPLAGTRKARASQQQPFRAPTEFLKVRQAFNENFIKNHHGTWKRDILRAILSKCSDGVDPQSHGILHIVADESNMREGLVYMRCKGIEAASRVFEGLHGWWCEGNLLSVRFIRQDRYFSRYPEAATITEPLTEELIN